MSAPRTSSSTDPLAALSDTFDGSDDIEARGWSIYNPGVLATSEIANGRYRHTPTQGASAGAFWFQANEGYLVHRGNLPGNLIAGDCDMRIRQVVQIDTFDALPTASQFRIAGLAAHDPDRTTSLNYVHVGAGHAGAGYAVETKNTVNSASVFPVVAISPTHPWAIDVRLVRIGADITSYYRHAPMVALGSDSGWTQHITNTRVDLPVELEWGLICYANPVAHEIGSDVEEAIFRTPS